MHFFDAESLRLAAWHFLDFLYFICVCPKVFLSYYICFFILFIRNKTLFFGINHSLTSFSLLPLCWIFIHLFIYNCKINWTILKQFVSRAKIILYFMRSAFVNIRYVLFKRESRDVYCSNFVYLSFFFFLYPSIKNHYIRKFSCFKVISLA